MYRLVYVTYLLMVASAGVTFVFLEDVETLYGIPAWGIGVISALSFLTGMVVSLFLAPFGDRGHLRTLGLLGFALAIVGNLTIGYSTQLWTIAGSRAMAGLGAGLFSVVGRKALIGETTDDSAEKIGGFISAAVAGFIAGPGLGAQLSEFGGIETPYLVIAVLLIVLAPFTMRWLSTVPVAITESIKTKDMLPLLKLPGVRAAAAAQVAVFFNIGVFDATVDEYLTDLGASNSDVGLILIAVGTPLLILPRLVGKFVDQHPRPASVMIRGSVVLVPIILTLGVWTGIAVFVAFSMMQTMAESTIFPSATRVILDETGAAKSAVGTGLLDAMGSAAAGLSAFIAPVLYDATDGPLGSFGMSGLVALALTLFAWVSINQRDAAQEPL